MHTPVEFFLKVPEDLFRRGGATKPRFDYIRLSPPKVAPEKFDLKVKIVGGKILIDHKSGGLSLFNKPDFRSGSDWWVIPKGSLLPPGFTISKDLTGNKFSGHYSVRSLTDIEPVKWTEEIGKWAEKYAIHIDKFTGKAVSNNV